MEEINKFFDGDKAVDIAEIANAEIKEARMDNEERVEEVERVKV